MILSANRSHFAGSCACALFAAHALYRPIGVIIRLTLRQRKAKVRMALNPCNHLCVMAGPAEGRVPAIYVFFVEPLQPSRGWPGRGTPRACARGPRQARP